MKVIPTLAEDITVAISCMQDYRDTISITDSEPWRLTTERIERLFRFYYQLTGFDPYGEKK
jgi:hypothetical protein